MTGSDFQVVNIPMDSTVLTLGCHAESLLQQGGPCCLEPILPATAVAIGLLKSAAEWLGGS